MSLFTTEGVTHLPLGERPQYGMPYPEGIALASSNVTDDASGGLHSFTFNADPGFIYRLELVNWTRGEATVRILHCITSHRVLTSRTPGASSAFDLNWFLAPQVLNGGVPTFTVYTLGSGLGAAEAMKMIGRLPMGAALGGGAPGVSELLMFLQTDANINTITNEISLAWTYWKKEALYLPGFLSSFYEAPAVPPLLR